MKLKFILKSGILVLTLLVILSLNVLQIPEGPHGGILRNAGNYHIEMRNSQGYFNTWLLTKELNPISNKITSCNVRFFLGDSTVMDIELEPFKEDGFTSSTVIPLFSTCKITYLIYGKSVDAIFSNTDYLVKAKE